MATKNYGQQKDRKKRIESCTECNGKPIAVEFQVNGLRGKRCDVCFEVIEHGKVEPSK